MTNAVRWSEDQLADFQLRKVAARELSKPVSKPVVPKAAAVPKSALEIKDAAVKRFQALGRLPKGEMNKTERAYSEFLEEKKRIGQVIDWKFHPMNVRLAKNTFYEVDFLVLSSSLQLEIHEVKGGFTTEKGQMKIKLCAEALPFFRFLKAIKQTKKDGGGWLFQEF